MEFAIKIFIAISIKLLENFYGSFHMLIIFRFGHHKGIRHKLWDSP